MKCVRSGLRSFMPKMSCTKVPHESCRPLAVHGHRVQTLTEDRPRYAMRETGDILKVSESSVENYLHLHDYMNGFDVWAPQKLKGWGGHFLDLIPPDGSLWKVRELFCLQANCEGGMNC